MRFFLLVLLLASTASAQAPDVPPSAAADPFVVRGPLRLSGPRVGFTYLSDRLIDEINETYGEYDCDDNGMCIQEQAIDPSVPIVTQFGWQWERSLFQTQTGLTGVTEWVLLAGGLERGLLLPSASFVVGVRTPAGLEIGVGPNISLGGAAYAVTAGFNTNLGEVNVPINVAAVLGREGPRASVLIGFVVSEQRY